MGRRLHHSICLLLGLACVWWIVQEPFRPKRLAAAIPAEVDFLSVHRNLGPRCDAVLGNPLVHKILLLTGQDEDDLGDDGKIPKLVKGLGKRETWFAHTQGLDTGYPGWCMATWLGAKKHWYRLLATVLEDYQVVERRRGHTLYEIVDDDDEEPLHITASLVDGMFVGESSEDDRGVRRLVDCLDEARPSVSDTPLEAKKQLDAFRGERDGGYWLGLSPPLRGPLLYRIDALDESQVELSARGEWWEPLPQDAQPEAAAFLHQLLGPSPTLVLHLETAALEPVQALIPDFERLPFAELLSDAATRPRAVGLAILYGEHAGNWMGQRLPAFVLSVHLPGSDAVTAWQNGIIRELRQLTGRPLHPWPMLTPGPPEKAYTALVDPKTGTGAFDYTDKACFARLDDYLVLASNTNCLSRLLQGVDTAPEKKAVWFEHYEQEKNSGFLWADANGFASLLQGRLIAATTVLSFQKKDKYKKLTKNLNRAAMICSGLVHFDDLILRLRQNGAKLDAWLRLGTT